MDEETMVAIEAVIEATTSVSVEATDPCGGRSRAGRRDGPTCSQGRGRWKTDR